MKTRKRVADVVPGEVITVRSLGAAIEVTVTSVDQVIPEPYDSYRYDDFRGANTPYWNVKYIERSGATNSRDFDSASFVTVGEGL